MEDRNEKDTSEKNKSDNRSLIIEAGMICVFYCFLFNVFYLWLNFRIYVYFGIVVSFAASVIHWIRKVSLKKTLKNLCVITFIYIYMCVSVIGTFDSVIDRFKPEEVKRDLRFTPKYIYQKIMQENRKPMELEDWMKQKGVFL